MAVGEAKQFQWMDYPILDGKWRIGTLFKSRADEAVLTGCAYDGSEAVKAYKDGAWIPFEWVNPPMVLGKEYRTTERCNGKVVYTKLFKTGDLTRGGTFQYTSESVTPIRYSPTAVGKVLPNFTSANMYTGNWSLWCDIDKNTFTGYCGTSYTSCSFTVQVWYTKD